MRRTWRRNKELRHWKRRLKFVGPRKSRWSDKRICMCTLPATCVGRRKVLLGCLTCRSLVSVSELCREAGTKTVLLHKTEGLSLCPPLWHLTESPPSLKALMLQMVFWRGWEEGQIVVSLLFLSNPSASTDSTSVGNKRNQKFLSHTTHVGNWSKRERKGQGWIRCVLVCACVGAWMHVSRWQETEGAFIATASLLPWASRQINADERLQDAGSDIPFPACHFIKTMLRRKLRWRRAEEFFCCLISLCFGLCGVGQICDFSLS